MNNYTSLHKKLMPKADANRLSHRPTSWLVGPFAVVLSAAVVYSPHDGRIQSDNSADRTRFHNADYMYLKLIS